MSFDVKSLLTNFLLLLALKCTDSYRQLNDLLPIEDIMDLLNLCLDQLAFNSTLNDTKSYIVQVWRRHFPLLSRNCWCRTSRNAPFRLADERYHFGYVDEIFTAARHDEFDEFHHHFKEQISEIHFSREVGRKRINTRFIPLVFQKNVSLLWRLQATASFKYKTT